MFAITADQIDSRHGPDRAEAAIELLERVGDGRLALPAERTAGDEIQTLTADASTALDLVLALARTGQWSVGLGVGDVRTPLPDSTRAASGGALIAARAAVEAAKGRPLHVALRADPETSPTAAALEAMLDLLLLVRDRRSDEGWQLYDLVQDGTTQAEAAERLGITPQAASARAITGAIRIEAAARDGLVELLGVAESGTREGDA